MAKVACPTVVCIEPEEDKTHEENLDSIFKYIRDMTAQSPNNFQIQLVLPVEAMSMDEMTKLVQQGLNEAEAIEARELIPHSVDSSDNKVLYKLKEKCE